MKPATCSVVGVDFGTPRRACEQRRKIIAMAADATGRRCFFVGAGEKAQVDLQKLIDALPDTEGVVIVGIVHSHPEGEGFTKKDDPDVETAQSFETNRGRTRTSGRTYRVNFRASFISSPNRIRAYYPQATDWDGPYSQYRIEDVK